MLLTPIRNLNFYNTVVLGAVTLLERIEGDPRPRSWEKKVSLYIVCSIDDNAIERLITPNETFHCDEFAAAPTESSWHGH